VNALIAATVALSGVNLAVVVTLAFKWGRWSGIVDTRLDHIEQSLKGET
jgi:hypothetical protein